MKLQIVSDIHTEFYKKHTYKKYLKSFCKNSNDVDAIVIAGDLSKASLLEGAFEIFCGEYKNVIYTPGNHEYYQHSKDEADEYFNTCSTKFNNLFILNRDIAEINNNRFVGCTLWYPRTAYTSINFKNWSDCFAVKDGMKEWVFNEFELNKNFLQNNILEGDIVVTHMLPSWTAVHPKWVGNNTNQFFVADMESVIRENKPKLWVFGHTHEIIRDRLYNTDLVANPKGYPSQSNGYKDYIIEV